MRAEAWICVLLGVGLMAATGTVEGAAPDDLFGARSWPFAIGAFLVAINLPAVFARAKSAGAPEGYADIRWPVFLVALIPIVALPLLVEGVGFLLGSITATAWFMTSVGYRRVGIMTVVSIGFSVATTYFFTKIAYMPLPRGYGPFDDVSVFLLKAIGAY